MNMKNLSGSSIQELDSIQVDDYDDEDFDMDESGLSEK